MPVKEKEEVVTSFI
jgi:hypothetical protein